MRTGQAEQARGSRPASRLLRRLLGVVLGVLVLVWVRTLRVRVFDEGGALAPAAPGRRIVFAVWHGQQMALLGALRPPRRLVVLVSQSLDGELQTGVLGALGFDIVRGSSSRGGARALRALVHALRRGAPLAAFAVDGPRGPAGVAKPGALLAAAASGALLVPAASAAERVVVLRRAWDRFEVPLPFSRVVVVAGAPAPADPGRGGAERLTSAISAARARAEALLLRGRGRAHPGAYAEEVPCPPA
jgi:lysophospholipid acyltransferase (LPLAT)-like uncharacterized protein